MSLVLHPVWRDYRNRRRALVGLLVLLPVLAAAAGLLPARATATHGALVLSAWLTGFVAASTWFARFRCPYCRERFHLTWLVANPLSDGCLHCGFDKWRDPDAGRQFGGR